MRKFLLAPGLVVLLISLGSATAVGADGLQDRAFAAGASASARVFETGREAPAAAAEPDGSGMSWRGVVITSLVASVAAAAVTAFVLRDRAGCRVWSGPRWDWGPARWESDIPAPRPAPTPLPEVCVAR